MLRNLAEKQMFQLTAARRRLAGTKDEAITNMVVSTHSRPEAAGPWPEGVGELTLVSTHSRPEAAGIRALLQFLDIIKFQLTAARRRLVTIRHTGGITMLFQLTAARRRLVISKCLQFKKQLFQLTAARRRLVLLQ